MSSGWIRSCTKKNIPLSLPLSLESLYLRRMEGGKEKRMDRGRDGRRDKGKTRGKIEGYLLFW
jgi:hypothetical protein